MSQYLLEKYQILVCLLGTWNMIELMESNPASTWSLHHFDIYEIKGECDIEGCPDDSIRKGNLTEWREFLRWDKYPELFFPLTRTTLTRSLDSLGSASEEGILARIVFSIVIPEMKEYFFLEWMIDEPTCPEYWCMDSLHGQDYIEKDEKARKILQGWRNRKERRHVEKVLREVKI